MSPRLSHYSKQQHSWRQQQTQAAPAPAPATARARAFNAVFSILGPASRFSRCMLLLLVRSAYAAIAQARSVPSTSGAPAFRRSHTAQPPLLLLLPLLLSRWGGIELVHELCPVVMVYDTSKARDHESSSRSILRDSKRARAHRRNSGPLAHPNTAHPRYTLATPLESVLSAVVVLCRCSTG